MTAPTPPAIIESLGPVAAGEYAAAKDHYKPGLLDWARALPALVDAAFADECAHAIYHSASVSRFRGNWEHEHFKASACFYEARRRHRAAGHSEDCSGDTLYARAHARVMRENGYRPSTPSPCTCSDIIEEKP